MGDALNQALDMAAAAAPRRAPRGGADADGDARPGAAPAPPPPAHRPRRRPAGAPAAVLLLSDGAQTAGTADPLAVAQRARELGIPVYTIALGTPAGRSSRRTPPAPASCWPSRRTRPPCGASPRSPAGSSSPPRRRTTCEPVYEGLAEAVNVVEEPQEITAGAAGAGAALLLAGGALALVWFNRFP